MKNDAIMMHIKSRILDVYNENLLVNGTTMKWFNDLKIILSEYFGVEMAHYLIFDLDTFSPLRENHAYTKKMHTIKWLEIEAFFYEKDFTEIPFWDYENDMSKLVKILLRDPDNKPIGLLVMDSTVKWNEFSETENMDEFVCTISKLVKTIKQSIILVQQENQYRHLFSVTKAFNSTLDSGEILNGTLFAINNAFPQIEPSLILSNDQDRKTSVPYKLFDYTSERTATVDAYVSGEITTEFEQDSGVRLINVPIKGKQAIYGILQLAVPKEYFFSTRQKEFAISLAEITGSALENAKLYIQSHKLVSDLQLINETSHTLNRNISLDEMLVFLRNQLMKSFLPEQICFVFIEEEGYRVSTASNDYFHTNEGQLYIQHVANHFNKVKDSLFIADFNRLTKLKYGYRSLVAVPLKEQNTITGFSIVLHKEPYYFSFDAFKLMQSLIQHSSLAISNSTLRNKLQEMVNRDHLTNLFARKYLDKYVESSMIEDDRGVFALIDIDDFKQVNDTYGHQIGDEILKQIASIIQKKVVEKGIGARWGGEELALYYAQMTLEEGIETCKQLLVSIPLETNPSVTVSIGVSSWEQRNNIDFRDLFHQTDIALYKAKNKGKNQLSFMEVSQLS
ncbi:sensor domain-containing diguanylate cyclase [Psychrobacillus sp. OK032]|uniref:sensor domain-containing diguanylate cyclase n=1 Tax=Psychrobacillus sp. OK032 TaxID=1884358 RepID=UPI0008CE9717|nr:sensor domain-containing diguanylate cyclase [Psychrobacillus sp. OK032]SER91340.1 diguanylate cyclase with GAF sensor [Psychrobacillus sp. OK032]